MDAHVRACRAAAAQVREVSRPALLRAGARSANLAVYCTAGLAASAVYGF
ncbi:hypothetical protein BN2475_270143 [Paraburkholderia ribeironis]|uniref:Uncharacterized protein n=1 Tax=Paraburkholderia ribeironis TaxID=1247936 RepID=A0A1N7S0G0_9BURK|nr:hypothetical protein BN2475_270143 [Paraburkholderia ribeironis]